MKLSLSMWSVHRIAREENWSALDFLTFCQAEGIDQVELLNVFWKDCDREVAEVAKYAQDHHIQIVSYAVGNNFVHQDPLLRQAALKEITDAFPIAHRLGTNIIRVFSGSLPDSVSYDTAIDWIVAGLSAAAQAAEAEGITLCLENHGKLAGSGAQVKHIIEAVGSRSLRSTFDTGNFLLVNEHPTEAARTLIPYIGHVHFKDFKSVSDGGKYRALNGQTYDGVSAGVGDVELDVIIQLLEDSGYQGAYVLEYEGQGSEADGIRESFAYCHKFR